MEPTSEKDSQNKNYRWVFILGIIYVLLLGLFTYLFNNPIT